MKKFSSAKMNKEVVGQLDERFFEGEALSVADIEKDYLQPPRSDFQKILNKRRVVTWLRTVRAHLWKREGVWLTMVDTTDGQVNSPRVFGIARTQAQGLFAMNQYGKLATGVMFNGVNLARDLRHNLPAARRNKNLSFKTIAKKLLAQVEEREAQ